MAGTVVGGGVQLEPPAKNLGRRRAAGVSASYLPLLALVLARLAGASTLVAAAPARRLERAAEEAGC